MSATSQESNVHMCQKRRTIDGAFQKPLEKNPRPYPHDIQFRMVTRWRIPSDNLNPVHHGCQHKWNPILAQYTNHDQQASIFLDFRTCGTPIHAGLVSMVQPASDQKWIKERALPDRDVRMLALMLEVCLDQKTKFIISPDSLLILQNSRPFLSLHKLVTKGPQMFQALNNWWAQSHELITFQPQQPSLRNQGVLSRHHLRRDVTLTNIVVSGGQKIRVDLMCWHRPPSGR